MKLVPRETESVTGVRWQPMSKNSIREIIALTESAHDVCIEIEDGAVQFCVKPAPDDKWIDVRDGDWLIQHPTGTFERMTNVACTQTYREDGD